MLKKISLLISALCLSLVIALPVMANNYYGGDWSVVFNTEKTMESNFHTYEMQDILKGLQPGDDASFSVKISNAYPETTTWYMTNKIIQSLEDLSANQATSGGGYTYRLTYTNHLGEVTVIFSSDTVGGDVISPAGEGLNEATSALKEWFKLDDLAQGQGGVVELYVGLDGETQNNDYQDTLAELQVNFAVELNAGEIETTTQEKETPAATQPATNENETPSIPFNVVRTGDVNNSIIYYVLMGAAGLVILAVVIIRIVAGRRKGDE